MPTPPSLFVQAFVAAALPLALTACSSSSAQPAAQADTNRQTSARPATSSSAPAVATSTDPNAGLPTGTQLKAALAAASFFGTGYSSDPATTRDTGDSYEPQQLPDVPKPDCSLLGTTGWATITGAQGVSFAEDDYVDKADSAEMAQEIDAYQGTTADTLEKALGTVAKACPSYTDSQTSTKVTVTEKPVAGLGDEAYAITLTDSAWIGGTTLEAVRVGRLVVAVMTTGGKDNGAAQGQKLALYLANRAKGLA